MTRKRTPRPTAATYSAHVHEPTREAGARDAELLAAQLGADVWHRFHDGMGELRERPGRLQLVRAARRRAFSVVVVPQLGALGAPHELAGVVEQLQVAGVRVVSVRESWTRDAAPAAVLGAAQLATDAATLVRELRSREGLAKSTKRVGRPPVPRSKVLRGEQLVREKGLSFAAAAREVGIGATTLRDHLRAS